MLQGDWTIFHTTVFLEKTVLVRVKFQMMSRVLGGLYLRADWTICHKTVFLQMAVSVRVKFPMMNRDLGGL